MLMLAAALLLPVQSLVYAAACADEAPPATVATPCHEAPAPATPDQPKDCPHCSGGLACTPAVALMPDLLPVSLPIERVVRLRAGQALPSPESSPDRLDRPPRSR